MTSERKIAAARANGAKSRGPKTDAGKRRSSQNSRKHGLYARTPPDETGIPETLTATFAAYWLEFHPQTPRAVEAVKAKIEAERRIFLLERMGTALMAAGYERLRALASDPCFAGLLPDQIRGALYFEAMARMPAILFRCLDRCRRVKRRADAVLRREKRIQRQRTKIAPAAAAVETPKTSERTNRAPRHAHPPKTSFTYLRTNRRPPGHRGRLEAARAHTRPRSRRRAGLLYNKESTRISVRVPDRRTSGQT